MNDKRTTPTIDLKALRASLRDPNHKGFKGQRFNRYDLLAEINRGGMGVVLRAKHVELGSLVALKLLASQDPGPEATGRFRREAKVLAQLKHPNVVGISDLGEDNGIHFLAMELIEGPDLHGVIKETTAKGKYLPYERTVEITLAMAKALAYCHEKGAIHRDIKPQNMLIEHKTDRCVLTDFGLVKKDPTKMKSGQSAAVSQAGTLLGTPSFMSPEQFEPGGKHGKVGPKSDVWGLGATLFFMLTGAPPFRAGNVVELYSLVLNEPAPVASAVRPGVPTVLDEICAACLTKPVADRLSMDELVKRLETVQTTPKALTSSAGGSGARHLVTVIVLFALMAGIALATNPDKVKRLFGMSTEEAPPTDGDGSDGGTDGPQGADNSADAEAAKLARNRKGAEDGEVDFMVLLGKQLIGSEKPADKREAVSWFEKAAADDDREAMFWLGRMNVRGEGGLEKDDATGVGWLKNAAEDGHMMAMVWLGDLSRQGRVTGAKDPKQALAWFNKVLEGAGPGDEKAKGLAKEAIAKLNAGD